VPEVVPFRMTHNMVHGLVSIDHHLVHPCEIGTLFEGLGLLPATVALNRTPAQYMV